MTNKLTHHHLSAEWVRDTHGTAIMLTQQDGIEDPQTVLVHPWQLRAACEHFGVVASDRQAAKTIGPQFDRWTKAGGQVQPGLVKRRAAERMLFES